MGPGLGQRLGLGLESLPRLATSGRPVWSGGLGTLGAPAAVGAAAATSTAVGARGSADVEPDCKCLGVLEQRNMDSGLTKRQTLARERPHRAERHQRIAARSEERRKHMTRIKKPASTQSGPYGKIRGHKG